jgi:hypothetical protein
MLKTWIGGSPLKQIAKRKRDQDEKKITRCLFDATATGYRERERESQGGGDMR